LERESLFHFNRYYLLSTLVLSVVVPLIPMDIFTNQVIFEPPASAVQLMDRGIQARYTIALLPEPILPENFKWGALLAGEYILICVGLLFRFGSDILWLVKQIRTNEVRNAGGITLVLLESPTPPHSFLNFVFLDKTEYLNGNVERDIVAHERAHVMQRHSLDIMLVEFLKVLF
jgi:hypothetical protein